MDQNYKTIKLIKSTTEIIRHKCNYDYEVIFKKNINVVVLLIILILVVFNMNL